MPAGPAANEFQRLAARLGVTAPEEALERYRKLLPDLERALWGGPVDDVSVAHYQRAFRDYEALLAEAGGDDRHRFVVVIPVADRPRHLAQCLASLLHLCRCYGYGGERAGRYRRLRVLVADDSRQPESLARHAELAREFDAQGLSTEWFGPEQQIAQFQRLPPRKRAALARVIGPAASLDPADFGHKGAAITRNIAYLRLRQLLAEDRDGRTLVQFIDSDQEFCVLVPGEATSRRLYAINYFHHLDRIFSQSDAAILTGKVVGDPPVSPAVMTSNFLEDVIGFFSEQSALDPGGDCRFHQPVTTPGDAAYHDMAERFGFGLARVAYRYRCRLQGVHGNGACLADFAGRLRGFFDGEHPTRATYFDYQGDLSETRPARTIYTGNYVLRPECLDWFIPFAGLKLRMAGPVLGRLLKAELGPRFVSANLPMLHQRTLDKTGLSECRPGVDQAAEQIDLSGEFERQYFGDLMLFGIERLTASGYPAKDLPAVEVLGVLTEVEAELRQSYHGKQTEVLAKSESLRVLLQDADPRWQQADWARARERFAAFLDSIEHNFGADSPGWALIDDPEHCRARLRQLTSAIGEFGADRAAWREAMQ